MKVSNRPGGVILSCLAVGLLSLGCSDGTEGTPFPIVAAPTGRIAVDTQAAAHGWARVWKDGGATNGGAKADASHIYTVTSRTELVQALYPDAVIAEDGTFTSQNGPDATPKIIFIKGKISLSTNRAGTELALADYACPGYDFAAYKAAYDPTTWNKTLVDGKPKPILACPGTQEELRDCSRRNQRAVVQIKVGSNTSLLGLGDDAKIVHGHLIIGGPVPTGAPPPPLGILPLTKELAEACGVAPPPTAEPTPTPAPAPALVPTADNVVVRNITFEDAFDYFPAWDPADSYSTPPETAKPDGMYPLCQLTLDEATGAGPHQCPGGRWNSSYDNITVQNATHVWIDHNTFNDGDRETQKNKSEWAAPYDLYANRVQPHDGALDINGFSDFVTVSRNVFRNHDKVMLIGGSDTAKDTNGWGYLSVTVNHNRFINCGQRTPRVRFGKVHLYSNYVEGALPPQITTLADLVSKPMPNYPMTSALTIGYLAQVYSENNEFVIKPYEFEKDGMKVVEWPTSADVINTAHKAAPTEGDTPDVGKQTYFFDKGSRTTKLKETKTADGMTKAEAAQLSAELVKAAQDSAVKGEDPALVSTEDVWKPASTYKYTASTAANAKADTGISGAAKITILQSSPW